MYKSSDGKILESIRRTLCADPYASQRTLAKNAELSLGMLNAALKRFASRGWILLTNLNARKIKYALTEEGMAELARRSKDFIRGTFSLISRYDTSILNAVRNAKLCGKKRVVLHGQSYIAFLIEYACARCGMEFIASSSADFTADECVLHLAGELTEAGEFASFLNRGCVNVMDLV
ncbi:MAG: winged helix-turn-helix transcriptional regulator [Bacteroides sp.]|nr:winged helix-turn-helix transcriptional regulator [Prevotella sp.]MCM1408553.1 winged helix-turn-helix transcriptional regulator [Treponema brennaborense]MCM1470733.1 winged helix-turn-helix transcriptional regulator [Bacteroides sp.]